MATHRNGWWIIPRLTSASRRVFSTGRKAPRAFFTTAPTVGPRETPSIVGTIWTPTLAVPASPDLATGFFFTHRARFRPVNLLREFALRQSPTAFRTTSTP